MSQNDPRLEPMNSWKDFVFKNHQHFEPILREAFERHLDQIQQAKKELDEEQLFKVFCEALVSGDFIKQVTTSGAQNFIYAPFSEADRLRNLYNELLNAVARKFPEESRHQTALRYIQEAECRAGEGNAVKEP